MADMPTPPGETSCSASVRIRDAAIILANRAAPTSTVVVGESSETIELLAETLAVSKRRKATGSVRIGTRTETIEALAEVELDRYRVEVTRVPVGRVVDVAPLARAEGDTTIVPVVEEHYVVVRQLVLVEEVRIRHVLERETVSEPVLLRRQRAVIERLDPGGVPGDG